jgi:uncharacterized protein YecT (DUF1311 family)
MSIFARRLLTALATTAAAAVLFPVLCAAETPSTEEVELSACTDWGAPGAIAQCLIAAVRKDGAILELEYKNALVRSGSNAKELRASQRAWLTSQQRVCGAAKLEGYREGPGYAELNFARCALRTTIKRIEELKSS